MAETGAFTLAEARQILERTPATLRALLRGLSDTWLAAREGPDTWSPVEVVAHLADLEEVDWMTRTRIILDQGEATPFPPIDRVRFRASLREKSLAQLLDAFAERRSANLVALAERRLEAEQLARTGTHPTFGRVTLEQLLAAWVVHDLTHLAQIVRVLAKRYDADVGPWKQFLGVLNRG
jgi:uncharacterized damage-inducible protein DinB